MQVLWSIDNDVLKHEVVLATSDRILIEPQASRAAPLSGNLPGFPTVVPNVPTHFRFCQPAPGRLCKDQYAITDDRLELSAPNETAAMPCHRVTMSTVGARGATKTYNYNSVTSAVETWDFSADEVYWNAQGWVVVAPEQFDQATASGLDGVFWVHAQTLVGSGLQPPDPMGVHGPELANAHFELDPERIVEHVTTKIALDLQTPFFLWWTLPDPWRWRGPPEWVSAVQLLTLGTADDVALVNATGRGQVVNELMGPDLHDALLDPALIWIKSAEAPLPGISEAPVAVALTVDAAVVANSASYSSAAAEMLLGDRDLAVPPPAGSSTDARTGFASSYSRALRTVFVVGGSDSITGAPLSDIRMASLDDRSWVTLPTTLPVDIPLAAVASARDESLYVLDTDSLARTARLLRFPVRGKGGEVVASWTRTGAFERYWLETDLQGSVLLVASNATTVRFGVARIRTGAVVEPERVVFGDEALMWPVVHTDRGHMWYPVNGSAFTIRRTADLGGSPVSRWNECAALF